MDDEVKRQLDNLQGRILAEEMISRMVLVGFVSSQKDPLAAIKQMKHDFISSLQILERPIGPGYDEVWEEAAKAIELTFEQAQLRVENALPE